MLFVECDPQGLEIYCTEERWNNHITAAHPELLGNELLARKAIRQPDCIFEKGDHFRYYYRLAGVELGKYRHLYILAIVRREGSYRGKVITAYITGNIKEGDLIWIKRDL